MGWQKLEIVLISDSTEGLCRWLSDKNPPANAGESRDVGSIPGSGRSPGGGKATHSNILAWRIPWTEEPGGLQSMELQRVRHDWSHDWRWLAPQPEVIISDFRMQNSGLCSQLWVLGANTGKLKKIPPSVLHYRAIVKAHVCVLSHSVVSDSLRPSGLKPTAKLFCPWNSPGKNTGVGCHFLLQGHLLHPRIETTSSVSPALQADSLPAEPSREPYNMGKH